MRQPPTVLWAQLTAPGEPAQQLSVASGFPAFQNCQPEAHVTQQARALWRHGTAQTQSPHPYKHEEKAAPTHGEIICTKCSDQCLDS